MPAWDGGGNMVSLSAYTLSASYAESGDFDKAVRWQEQAVRMAGERMKYVLAARLELYKQGQPYRDSN